jgi:cobaltochelatase CobS
MIAPTELAAPLPDIKVSVRQMFGFDTDLEVPAYAEADEHVPDIDSDYRFDRPTTLAILAGFARNRRVREIDSYRAGGSPAQLAMRAR